MDMLRDILNARLLAAGKHRELSDQYQKLKTDEERIVFTLNTIQEYKIVPNTADFAKNAKESEKLREQGNKVFVKGVFNNMTCIEALKLYTKSIANAPYPSEQLALGYANRSAVLFQLGLYLECIQDIDRALGLSYPDNLRAKLCLRKTECLMILGNDSVEDVLKEALHWLDKMSLSDTSRGKLKTKLDTLQDKTVQAELRATEIKILQFSPLPTIQSYNKEVPCASDAVAIKHNELYGRHIVATRNIDPGEVIAVEPFYSVILMQESIQTHCSYCLRVCWANIPCNYCTYVMYCSEECRNIEWNKCHDIECIVFPILSEYAAIHYNHHLLSVRLAILALKEAGGITELRRMLKEIDEHEDLRTKGFSRDGKLHSDRYISVYSLVTNVEKRSVSDLFKRSFDACFILFLLATRTVIFGAEFPEDSSVLAKNNDITFFGSLILKHQQIIPCNMHTLDEMQGLEYVDHGTAAMPFHSLINHSCSPNVIRHSRPNHSVIYAMYPIRKGEQLSDNYGNHYAIMPKVTRQQKLLKQYYFTCCCITCVEDWPLYHKLQSYKTLVKRSEDKAKIERGLRKFNEYVHLATEGKTQHKPYIIKDLLRMVRVLHDRAPMPCKEMNNVIETLKRVYDLNGSMYEIPQVRIHRK